MSQPHSHVSPQSIFQMVYAPLVGQALKSGVSLEVFTHIHGGKKSVAALAEATGAVPRNLGILLNALTSLQYLSKPDAATYELTPVSEQFLVKGKQTYIGDFVFQIEQLWQAWGGMEQVVRQGLPEQNLQERPDLVEMFKELVPRLFPVTYPNAMALAGRLSAENFKPASMLDVAAGTAAWGIAFAQRDPNLRVTAWDFEGVLEVTRSFTGRLGVAQQFDYFGGDIWETSPEQQFDSAILGHICHGYSPAQNQALFERMHKLLVPGGRLLIPEFVADDNRSQPGMPLLFALNMMTNTPEGNTYTMPEYADWLAKAGFSQVELIELPPFPGGVVSAVRE